MKLQRMTKDDRKLYAQYRKAIEDIRGESVRIPTLQEVADYTSLPVYTVISDLQRIRMVGMVKGVKYLVNTDSNKSNKIEKIKISESVSNIPPKDYKPLTEKREYLYQQHFLGLPPNERPTLTELSHIIGKSKAIIAKDIRYFERKYNCKFPIFDTHPIKAESTPIIEYGLDGLLNEVCSSEYYERLVGYLDYIKEKGFIPTKTELSQKFGLTKEEVSADLSYLGLKCMTQSEIWETFRTPVEQRAFEREGFYRENYFESDYPLSIDDMAVLLNEHRQVVHSDIQFLNQKYKINPKVIREKRKDYEDMFNLSYYKSLFENYFEKKGYIPTERATSEELGLSQTIVHLIYKELSYIGIDIRAIPLEKHRKPFYQEHYFNSSKPMSYAKMGKALNISTMVVCRNIAKLKSEYACSEIDDKCEAYQKLKGSLNYDSRLAIRKSIYESMVKHDKHYSINYLCSLFGCHHDVIDLAIPKLPILHKIIIK